MKNNTSHPVDTQSLIAEAYECYHARVLSFIAYRINNYDDAEDLTQDVFLRLIDYKSMLRPDTIKCFIYTIARNRVTDYLRRYLSKKEYTSYIYDTQTEVSTEAEQQIIANDLSKCEMTCVSNLPAQRQKIYLMTRFEDKTSADIAKELQLSPRTVENHLLLSRKAVRAYMKQCI